MKTSIKIDEKNKEKIQAVIDQVQLKARVRTISVEDIMAEPANIESHLGLTKKALVGVSASIDLNAQKFTSRYKGIPESTQFGLEYTKSGWVLTYVARLAVEGNKHTIRLTEQAIEQVLMGVTNY